jgi:hypothetical protein
MRLCQLFLFAIVSLHQISLADVVDAMANDLICLGLCVLLWCLQSSHLLFEGVLETILVRNTLGDGILRAVRRL